MSPLLVHFLRRVALFALVLAALAGLGPRLLRELGFIGPKAPEVVAGAQHSLDAARHYGADDTLPASAKPSACSRRPGRSWIGAVAKRGEWPPTRPPRPSWPSARRWPAASSIAGRRGRSPTTSTAC